MNGREIIKDIMKKINMGNSTLASNLGITPAALWDRIDTQPRNKKPRKDIPVSLLAEMVQPMGYKVLVVPSNTKIPTDGYIISSSTNSTAKEAKTDVTAKTENNNTQNAPVKTTPSSQPEPAAKLSEWRVPLPPIDKTMKPETPTSSEPKKKKYNVKPGHVPLPPITKKPDPKSLDLDELLNS